MFHFHLIQVSAAMFSSEAISASGMSTAALGDPLGFIRTSGEQSFTQRLRIQGYRHIWDAPGSIVYSRMPNRTCNSIFIQRRCHPRRYVHLKCPCWVFKSRCTPLMTLLNAFSSGSTRDQHDNRKIRSDASNTKWIPSSWHAPSRVPVGSSTCCNSKSHRTGAPFGLRFDRLSYHYMTSARNTRFARWLCVLVPASSQRGCRSMYTEPEMHMRSLR